MVVLPGTFISTLFAIPLFDWDAESWQDVPKSRFWFYWAITIPLTIIVLVTWVFWQRSWNKQNIELDRKARDSAEYAPYSVRHISSTLEDSNHNWATLGPPTQTLGGVTTLQHRKLRNVSWEDFLHSGQPVRTSGSAPGSGQRERRMGRDQRRVDEQPRSDWGG
jgi:hypothetical protein